MNASIGLHLAPKLCTECALCTTCPPLAHQSEDLQALFVHERMQSCREALKLPALPAQQALLCTYAQDLRGVCTAGAG